MIVIGNQDTLFFTNGKIGTTTLLSSGYGSQGIYAHGNIADIKVQTYAGANNVLLIRHPVERLHKGLIQQLFYEIPNSFREICSTLGKYNFREYYLERMLTTKFWDNILTQYRDNCCIPDIGTFSSQEAYHFGPWLANIEFEQLPYEVVNIHNLSLYLAEIGKEPITVNKSSGASFGMSDSEWASVNNVFVDALKEHQLYAHIIKYLNADLRAYQQLSKIEKYASN